MFFCYQHTQSPFSPSILHNMVLYVCFFLPATLPVQFVPIMSTSHNIHSDQQQLITENCVHFLFFYVGLCVPVCCRCPTTTTSRAPHSDSINVFMCPVQFSRWALLLRLPLFHFISLLFVVIMYAVNDFRVELTRESGNMRESFLFSSPSP